MQIAKSSSPWLYLVLSVVSLIAAVVYLLDFFNEEPSTTNIVMAFVWLAIAIVWIYSYCQARAVRAAAPPKPDATAV